MFTLTLSSHSKRTLAAGAVLLAAGVLPGSLARADAPTAASLTTLYSFNPYETTTGNLVGFGPHGLIAAPSGGLYTLTQYGGPNDGNGALINFQTGGTAVSITYAYYSGLGADSTLLTGAGSSVYGTDPSGGANSNGAVYSITPNSSLAFGTQQSVLYSFTAVDVNGVNADGSLPIGSLLTGSDGSLYGETQQGGSAGEGVVYKINRDGTGFTVLHSFGSGSDGAYPAGGLVAGPDGFLYGVTSSGGSGSDGLIFKVAPDGSSYFVLYQFSDDDAQAINTDGASPEVALTLGSDGLLYGVTPTGGPSGTGVVFQLGTDGSGFNVLYAFSGTDGASANSDGAAPNAALVKDTYGNFYGTTSSGGTSGQGALFLLTARGIVFNTLYSFAAGDGSLPILTAGTDGLIYGTTADGGVYGDGSLFRVDLRGSATHLLWDNTVSGAASIWNLEDSYPSGSCRIVGPYAGWTAVALADGPNGQTRLLWDNADGRISLWNLSDPNPDQTCSVYGPYPGWKAVAMTVGLDNVVHILWDNTDGRISVWNQSDAHPEQTCRIYSAGSGWRAVSLSVGPDNALRLLWDNTNGQASVWNLADTHPAQTGHIYGPYANWTAVRLRVGPDSVGHLLWDSTDGRVSLWNLADATPDATCLVYGPYPGWAGTGLAIGSDNAVHLLWDNTDGQISVWNLTDTYPMSTCLLYGPYTNWFGVDMSSAL